jgi:TetR/AcrR family transcriptional regulator
MHTLGDTEQKILNAATEIFLQKGKDGARMQEIADRAGINKALLHYYFRSKDRLFHEVFKNEVKTILNNILDAVSETEDFYNFLNQFVRTYLKFITPRRELMRFVLWEIDKSKETIGAYFWEVFNQHGYAENPLIGKIKHAIDEGQIKPVDPSHLMLSILGMCIFPFMAAPLVENILRYEIDLENPAFLKKREEGIVDLIWHGLKSQ